MKIINCTCFIILPVFQTGTQAILETMEVVRILHNKSWRTILEMNLTTMWQSLHTRKVLNYPDRCLRDCVDETKGNCKLFHCGDKRMVLAGYHVEQGSCPSHNIPPLSVCLISLILHIFSVWGCDLSPARNVCILFFTWMQLHPSSLFTLLSSIMFLTCALSSHLPIEG